MRICDRIYSYIIDNGIYLKKVAEKSGIPQKKFYRLVNGKTNMTVEDYEAICRNGLGLDPGYFFKQMFSKTEKSA